MYCHVLEIIGSNPATSNLGCIVLVLWSKSHFNQHKIIKDIPEAKIFVLERGTQRGERMTRRKLKKEEEKEEREEINKILRSREIFPLSLPPQYWSIKQAHVLLQLSTNARKVFWSKQISGGDSVRYSVLTSAYLKVNLRNMLTE